MDDRETARRFADLLTDTTARGIMTETAALIRSGKLPLGTRLPTVRELAYCLQVSPATVSEAWRELRRQKMITGRGRNGSWVSGDAMSAGPSRMASIGKFREGALDLSLAVPDIDLLPPLHEALAHGAKAQGLNLYERTPILEELRAAVARRWPYRPETFLATNGGYNAVYATLHALVMPGAAVAVENPTALRLLDIVEDLGAEIVPVESDHEGPLPDSLAQALQRHPTVFLFQPRTHSVTGFHVTQARMDALAGVLRNTDTLVIEDDGIGDVSTHPPLSLGAHMPDRVIHILSFSKSLGPDLRLAVLSGPERIVEQIQSYRSFSAGWTSRILQSTTAWLLNSPESMERIEMARDIYARRRRALQGALARRGIALPQSEGMCLWIPVKSEQFALVTLAARNISVLPGSKYTIGPGNRIRVATSILKDRYDEVAEAIWLAADQ